MSDSPPLGEKMTAEQAIAWLRELGEPLDAVVDRLLERCGPYGKLAAIRAVLTVYGLSLNEARNVIEKRQFELAYADQIAASNTWVEERVAEILSSDKTLTEAAEALLARSPSGFTPWEPTGLVERATVISKAFGVEFIEAVKACVRVKS